MSRIRIINEEGATERLPELYRRIASARGSVANVLKIHSLLPQTMEDHFNLYKTLMFNTRSTGLRRRFLEMIAVVVSSVNNCFYCVTHHSEPLKRLLKNDALLTALQNLDWQFLESVLKPPVLTALFLAEKITKDPSAVTDDDIKELQEQGYSDDQILHIVLVINYFNFVNRNVLALGVELEQDYATMCK